MTTETKLKVLASVFMAAFLFGFLCSLGLPIPSNVQLPLGDLCSVVVDADGHIFCDSAFYSRIQVYSNTGEFLTGWYVPGKHRYQLRIDDHQHLVVTTSKGQFEYDAAGVKLKEDSSHEVTAVDRAGSITPDKNDNFYSVESRYLFPHVEIHTPSGSTRSIVNGPVYLWPLSGPIPCWLITMLLIGLSRTMRAKSVKLSQ